MDTLESPAPLTSSRIARLAFETANRRLQKVLSKKIESRIRSVSFPDFSSIVNVESTASELEAALGKLIELRQSQKDSTGRVETIKGIIEEWFRASYPFARVFLSIISTSSQVCLASIFFLRPQIPMLNPYALLFAGLLVLNDVNLPLFDKLILPR